MRTLKERLFGVPASSMVLPTELGPAYPVSNQPEEQASTEPISCSLEECADTKPHYHRGDDELVRLIDWPGSETLKHVLDPRTSTERRITMSYGDAEAEAARVCQRLGLDAPDFADVGDLIRFAYGQGWLACESRLASPDMADLINEAINWPGKVTEKGVESDNQHRVRAVQQVVAYGVKSEPR